MLARSRDSRRLSVEDVANRLKFGTRQIEALEADDYERLPGMTFVRGMIRSYAKLLEIDPAPLIESLEQRQAPAVPVSVDRPAKRIPFPDGRSRSTRIYLLLSVAVLIGVGAVLYEWHYGAPDALAPGGSGAETPEAPVAEAPRADVPATQSASPQATPAPSDPVPVAPAAPTGLPTMVFVFDEASWVEVRDRADKVLFSQLNPAGSRQSVEGTPPFALVIGNASHVRLSYRDKPVDLGPHIKSEVARLTLQ